MRTWAKWIVLLPLAACGGESARSSADDALPGSEVDSEDALVAASCSAASPTRYDAALVEDECATVTTDHGTWLARPLFPEAPEPVRTRTCRFTWRPLAAGSGHAPDREALESAVTYGTRLTGTCRRGAPPVVAGELTDAEDPPVHFAPMGGAVGCDVCGLLDDQRRIWFVRPPEVDRARFRVMLANGRERPVQELFAAPPARLASGVIELPPPAAGLHYVTGSLNVR